MIREYEPSDRETLLAVWAESAALAHPFWPAARFDHERREIAETFLPVAETWVFEREGEMAGFIALLGDEVGGLFVSPRHQRCGIGRALMDWALRSRTHLELDVYEQNATGRAFYEAYGCNVVGERREEGTGLTILRLRLPADAGCEPGATSRHRGRTA